MKSLELRGKRKLGRADACRSHKSGEDGVSRPVGPSASAKTMMLKTFFIFLVWDEAADGAFSAVGAAVEATQSYGVERFYPLLEEVRANDGDEFEISHATLLLRGETILLRLWE